MRKAVADVFFDFNVPFEGYCDYLYLDSLGLVTTGVGLLCDPIEAAVVLPWKRRDGSLASEGEIRAAWNAVKGHQELRSKGGAIFARFTGIRLDRATVVALVRRKLCENETTLRATFAAWDSWPADAQLACHSMAWAMGVHGFARFPAFCAAAETSDFSGMAAECRVAPDAGSLKHRNDAQVTCLQNAALVVADGLDPEALLYAVSP